MAHSVSSMSAAFKYVQKDLQEIRPSSTILYDMIKPSSANQVGRKMLMPVILTYELGVTYGDGSAYAYNDDVAAVYDEAEVESNSVVLKSRIALEALERMKDGKAVEDHMKFRGSHMKASLLKFAELGILHGRNGIGTVAAVSAVNTGTDPDQLTITISDATWAPGIWSGMSNVQLDVYDGATKQNANAVLTLVSVDFENKQITISGDNTDLTAIGATTEKIYFRGAKANEQYGLMYQLDNASSLFGIDAASYDLWKSSEFPVAGALTSSKILQAVEKAQSKGGLDEDAILVISTKTFQGLVADLLPLRAFSDSYKKDAEIGHNNITINACGVKVEVIGHPMQMQGYGMILPKSALSKVGPTQEVSFKIPGRKDGEDYAEPVEGYDAIQFCGRFNFQVFNHSPAKAVLLSGIVNA